MHVVACTFVLPYLVTTKFTANWTHPNMSNAELARIWIACNLKGANPRDTLWNLAIKAFGYKGIGTNK